MLNPNLIEELKTYYREASGKRHLVIKESSDILRNSKQAIFEIHKNDLAKAEELIKAAKDNLDKFYKKEEQSNIGRPAQNEGAFRAAFEEFLEAKFFYDFLHNKEVTYVENYGPEFFEEYLSALCDVSGEIVRKAIRDVTEEKFDDLQKYRDFTQLILENLIKFNLTGKLRSKHDDAWRNLKRLEEIQYDVSLKK